VLAYPFTEGGTTAPASAPTLVAGAGGAVTTGNHVWVYSYVSAAGETGPSPVSATLNVTGGNQSITVSGITVGPVGTTARNLYRTTSGAATTDPYFLVTSIANNTTTIFVDTIADGSLTTLGPLQVNDRSGNVNNGAFVGSISWDTVFSSFFFKNRVKAPAISTPAGSGSYVRVPRTASLEPTTAVTVAAWVRPHAYPSSAFGVLVGKPGNAGVYYSYALGVNNSGQFFFRLTDVSDAGVPVTVTGGSFANSQAAAPFHVVGTYNGSLVILYVNGVNVAQSGDSGNINYAPSPEDLFIGGDTHNTNANADIDAVQIWNTALTPTQIAQLYSTEYVGVPVAAVPITDPGSGAFGNYSTGFLADDIALMVDAVPFSEEHAVREVALVVDTVPYPEEHAVRELALMVDAVAAAQNAAGMGIGSITPNFGGFGGGTHVTIKGFNFQNVTAVFVGGVAATSVVVVDQTTITAITGAHAVGLVDVRVDSSTFGTVIASQLYQYVGGFAAPAANLARGKQLTQNFWNQDPPGSFYTGGQVVAPIGVSTTLAFTLTDNPTTPQAVEVYVRHSGATGYGRMNYLVDYNVDIANKHIIWLGATAEFGLIASDQMIVCYPGQH